MEAIIAIIEKEEVHEKELIEVVEAFIKEKTGDVVTINLMKDIRPDSPLAPMMCKNQLQKLLKAYEIAASYFMTKHAS
tara:strand:- start:327 stop:560 length:234 start_codon:yes stop_codon:yes gene_type:complete